MYKKTPRNHKKMAPNPVQNWAKDVVCRKQNKNAS